jgi:RNA polymerase sigma factor (sigma-70 family)
MDSQTMRFVDPADMSWIVEKAGVEPGALVSWCQRVEQEMAVVADRYIAIFGHNEGPRQSTTADYASRLWRCVEYHWHHWTDSCPDNLPAAVSRIETLESAEMSESMGILAEVALAVALEDMNPKAAAIFEQRYMPRVRTCARQISGARGEDLVENFAAALVMPRQNAPPKIRSFQGRTSLMKWLRVVVTNVCLSQLRQKHLVALDAAPEVEAIRAPNFPPEDRKCLEILSPAVAAAVGRLDPADRLLIKLVLLDDTPQHRVARSLGIHSGNVTRRKQKIMDTLWNGIRCAQRERHVQADFRDCMESVVAGSDPLLTCELATLVGAAFGETGQAPRKGAPP